MRLASESSASSSIQRTTERQTSATTLRRWPSCGGAPGGRSFRGRRAGRRTRLEGLGAIRRQARRRAAAQAHADRACRRRQDHAFVVVLPERRVAAPAVDRLLEVADDGEARRRQASRHVVEDVEEAQRQLAQPLVDGDAGAAAAVRPVAADELGEPVQHRAGRPEAEGRQQRRTRRRRRRRDGARRAASARSGGAGIPTSAARSRRGDAIRRAGAAPRSRQPRSSAARMSVK